MPGSNPDLDLRNNSSRIAGTEAASTISFGVDESIRSLIVDDAACMDRWLYQMQLVSDGPGAAAEGEVGAGPEPGR